MNLKHLRRLLPLLLCLLAAPQLGAETIASPPPGPIGEPGTWSYPFYASASFGDEAGEIYQLRAGGERHWRNGLAFEISGMAGYFDSEPIGKEAEEEGLVVGFDLLFRWYFHRGDKWAVYADGGGGCVWFDTEFPTSEGTSFNFEPQGGMGLTRRVGPRTAIFFGARWHHISNGGIVGDGNDNRGYDGAMPYFGFTLLR